MAKRITSPVYVVGDNIDTDQIIPAQYLTLVPTIPDEYEKLGSYAMIGLPDDLYPSRFIPENSPKTEYKIVIAGKNFGCGSSREHAPIALGAAGVEVVIAESYARIFFRNSVATGELYPYESRERLLDVCRTGDLATVDFDNDTVTINDHEFTLKPMGDVRPVIEAGGIFNYARQTGMIPAKAGSPISKQ
jgi:3-isopropylmalate/(R)-2-methylmalate dehydratase small subunit